ncbi:histone-lysine N-methyltransferase SMYD3-like [Mya arenaria]|uniref:histone-lysine N-methyltransferase SMYD3-like n=1 Tax=Mya arenaria TaxID=6604 RepID=UPI0022E961D2|nr:histone-lysine N-methyltransferase SMYD3-like [Mya arenaria]
MMSSMMAVGEIILKEEPFCHVLLQSHRGLRCDQCFTLGENLKKCTGCSDIFYCNKVCQKRDWTVHKQECKCLKAIQPKKPLDSVRLLLRLVISQNLNLPQNNEWSRTLDDLMSHSEDIKKDAERSEQFAQVAFTLKEYAGSHVSLPDASKLLNLFGKMVINSYTICDGELKDLGVGMYLGGSRLDHSCSPNAVTSFHGVTLVVRATQDILDNSPNKVFISYIDQLAPRKERQTALKKQYYFDCACSRCSDEQFDASMTSFCCPKSGCDGVVGINNKKDFGACQTCGASDFSSDLKQGALAVLDSCQAALEQADDRKKQDKWKGVFETCKESIQKAAGVLHAHNVYLVRILDLAFDAAINLEKWELAAKYGARTLQPYCTFYGEMSPHLAVQLFKVGKLQLYLGDDLKGALQSLERAQNIFKVTQGEGHEILNTLELFVGQCREEMRMKLEKS